VASKALWFCLSQTVRLLVESLQVVRDQVLGQGIILLGRAENMARQLGVFIGTRRFSAT
jgi:hypothetical protein